MEWIIELDRQLGLLREAEAQIYYQADLGQGLDAADLKQIAERRRDLLTGAEIPARAGALLAEAVDPVTRRKAQLLRLTAVLARIEDDPEMLAIRHELEQVQHDFGSGMRSPEGMRSYLKATRRAARERIAVSNRLARREGFPDFPEAKLTCQELSVPGLRKTLAHVHKTCGRDCKAAIDALDAAGLSPTELDAAVREHLRFADDAFPAKAVGDIARRTLGAFGLDIAALPISIEAADMPHSGAVHALKIGRDIHVVMNGAKDGFARYALFLHELGHALYYAFVPDSVLLLDSRIGREGLAELWAAMIETPHWLRRFTNLRRAEIDTILDKRRQFHAYMVMTYVREALFELALYEHPDADVLRVWNAVTRQCFGIDSCSDIYSEFVFLYPLDIKDYVYADLIARAVIRSLTARFGDDLLRPEIFESIRKHYYQPANLRPWHRRFPDFEADGSVLTHVDESGPEPKT